MDKIFEIREGDGSYLTGFIRTNKTKDQLYKERKDGFTDYREISEKEFLRLKQIAWKNYQIFKI